MTPIIKAYRTLTAVKHSVEQHGFDNGLRSFLSGDADFFKVVMGSDMEISTEGLLSNIKRTIAKAADGNGDARAEIPAIVVLENNLHNVDSIDSTRLSEKLTDVYSTDVLYHAMDSLYAIALPTVLELADKLTSGDTDITETHTAKVLKKEFTKMSKHFKIKFNKYGKLEVTYTAGKSMTQDASGWNDKKQLDDLLQMCIYTGRVLRDMVQAVRYRLEEFEEELRGLEDTTDDDDVNFVVYAPIETSKFIGGTLDIVQDMCLEVSTQIIAQLKHNLVNA